MPLTPSAKNAMLDHLGTLATYVSAHSADPGTTGASEVSSARKPITWAAASAGSKSASSQPVLDIPAGATVAFIGYWSAATGGIFYGSDDVTAESYAGAGTYTVLGVTLNLIDA